MNCTDHAGEVLPSGIRIMAKTEKRKKFGIESSSIQSYYIQRCPKCGCTFEAVYSKRRKSCGCSSRAWDNIKNLQKNAVKKNARFGTNLGLIASDKISALNTSGHKGVWLRKDTGRWVAEICFQGIKMKRQFDTKEEAIEERCKMEKERKSFLDWYASLDECEKDLFSEWYSNNKKEFSKFYTEKMRET